MIKLNLHPSYIGCTYPGEYIPLTPLSPEKLSNEKLSEGASDPAVNIAELEDAFIIEVAAPGLKNVDFFVSISYNVLNVSVLHKETGSLNKQYRQLEFNYCCFKKEIVLPENIDADFVRANYTDGILCLRAPKSKAQTMNHTERIIIY